MRQKELTLQIIKMFYLAIVHRSGQEFKNEPIHIEIIPLRPQRRLWCICASEAPDIHEEVVF